MLISRKELATSIRDRFYCLSSLKHSAIPGVCRSAETLCIRSITMELCFSWMVVLVPSGAQQVMRVWRVFVLLLELTS
jgi:hypothetical protein